MSTSVGVGPLRVLSTVAATSSPFEKNVGCKQSCSTSVLRKAFQCAHGFGLLSPTSRRFKHVYPRVRAKASGSSSEDGSSTSTVTKPAEKSEVDKLMEGISFGQLCDEFECISSPAVEKTARQLVKDILYIKEGRRSLGNFSIFVKYKDPIRTFTGREKYKSANWISTAVDKPVVAVREMTMLSTSILNIKWTLRGKPKLPPASVLGGEVVLSVNSTYMLNQISGQVIEHEDEWDLAGSDPLAQAYFWTSRLAYSAVESGKDFSEMMKGVTKIIDKGKDENKSTYYPDPSGDPRKFFQVDDNPQRDLYQIGLLIASLYLLVQFLRLTL